MSYPMAYLCVGKHKRSQNKCDRPTATTKLCSTIEEVIKGFVARIPPSRYWLEKNLKDVLLNLFLYTFL